MSDQECLPVHDRVSLIVGKTRIGHLDIQSANATYASPGASGSKGSTHSSFAYRQQAANLMAQIKQDMRGSKRLVSVETEASRLSRADSSADRPFTPSESLYQRMASSSQRSRTQQHAPVPMPHGKSSASSFAVSVRPRLKRLCVYSVPLTKLIANWDRLPQATTLWIPPAFSLNFLLHPSLFHPPIAPDGPPLYLNRIRIQMPWPRILTLLALLLRVTPMFPPTLLLRCEHERTRT